ncbi:GDP-mannose pyrophosphatase NudK [Mucilaginibacter dorajii]|uniref:GDP-mannose pyrophosphatase n=1 Tax=Mucilaginibacter dorajii TaxID=692994 RepID=A0ABP7QLF5_9SPHI|nr:GDP-mannose pyrophosphatase NudK [Mucilaginibacter dorajii]MCS3734080.1 nudix-type nucleoside diphosphatase (YffH/AdpP family) [Mucilaginibacter dorajii]
MNKIKILKKDILSNNWYTLYKLTFEATKNDGEVSIITREAYDRGNGATILLYNMDKKTVILTRQFRIPTYVNGNESGMLIECCGGLLDKDNAEDCIRRETEEETGYQVSNIKKVFEAYMSPGSVTELLYFFIAEYTSDMKVSDGGGLDHEHEDIEVLELPFTQTMQMINTGEIKDGKTIMLLQHLQISNLLS